MVGMTLPIFLIYLFAVQILKCFTFFCIAKHRLKEFIDSAMTQKEHLFTKKGGGGKKQSARHHLPTLKSSLRASQICYYFLQEGGGGGGGGWGKKL